MNLSKELLLFFETLTTDFFLAEYEIVNYSYSDDACYLVLPRFIPGLLSYLSQHTKDKPFCCEIRSAQTCSFGYCFIIVFCDNLDAMERVSTTDFSL